MQKTKSSRDYLLYFVLKNKGNWQEIYKEISSRTSPTDDEYESVVGTFNQKFITILDKEYPESLKQGYKPPFVLFYQGNLNLLKAESKLAIGTSKSSNIKYRQMADLVLGMQEKDCFVLSNSGKLNSYLASFYSNSKIIVLNRPLNEFIDETRGDHLVLTEVPPTATATLETEMLSQRIISGISSKILIVSCQNKGSEVILINFALSQGKEIMVIPTDIFDKEVINNQFLTEGAIPISNAVDLKYMLQKQ